MSSITPFFCCENVITTVLARNIRGSSCGMTSASFRKVMSLGRMARVFCCVLFCVFVYSHDRIAKKSAPARRWARAVSRGNFARRISHLYTSGGMAFWWCTGPSVDLYALSCRLIWIHTLPCPLSLGSGQPQDSIILHT